MSVAGLFVGEKSTRESVLLGARQVAIYAERGENDCRITMSAGRQSAGINGPKEKGICKTVVLFGTNESKTSNRRIGWQIAPNFELYSSKTICDQ